MSGFSLVLLVWTDGQLRIPLGLLLWHRGGSSKYVLALELLSYDRNWLRCRPEYVLFDAWSPSKALLRRIRDYGWYVVCRLTKNRRFNGQPLRALWCHPYWTERGGLTGGVQVVVVRYGAKSFATNRLTLPAAEVRRLYRIRAQIEEMIRVCKDQLGLTGCQARSARAQLHHIGCCLMAFCVLERERHERGLSLNKLKSERDAARDQQVRQAYRQRLTTLDCRRLKFVDESGVNLAMTRLYGRAPAGERVSGSIPQDYGRSVTKLGALSARGLDAVMTVDGATDADVFHTYVKQVLWPTLARGDIVVMDNLQANKAVGAQQAMARRGARLPYLPPYSPDLSPIEPCWSKVKTALRKAKACTRGALDTAIAAAMRTVSLADAYGWFKYCGYALQ